MSEQGIEEIREKFKLKLIDNSAFRTRVSKDDIGFLLSELTSLRKEAEANKYALDKSVKDLLALCKEVAQLEKELGQRIVSEGQLALLLEEMDWKYIALRKERDSANEVINGISSGQVDLRTMEAVITHREQYTVQGT